MTPVWTPEQIFFHAKKDGSINVLSWDEYIDLMQKRKDWVLGWATKTHILFIKNGKSVGTISFRQIESIKEKLIETNKVVQHGGS